MRLVYLTKNLNKYIYKEVSYPSSIPIGCSDKHGHILIFAIFIFNSKIYILNSWCDYYNIIFYYFKVPLYARINDYFNGVRNKIAYKLILLAYKIKK